MTNDHDENAEMVMLECLVHTHLKSQTMWMCTKIAAMMKTSKVRRIMFDLSGHIEVYFKISF